jgi:hypothetical protein
VEQDESNGDLQCIMTIELGIKSSNHQINRRQTKDNLENG